MHSFTPSQLGHVVKAPTRKDSVTLLPGIRASVTTRKDARCVRCGARGDALRIACNGVTPSVPNAATASAVSREIDAHERASAMVASFGITRNATGAWVGLERETESALTPKPLTQRTKRPKWAAFIIDEREALQSVRKLSAPVTQTLPEHVERKPEWHPLRANAEVEAELALANARLLARAAREGA